MGAHTAHTEVSDIIGAPREPLMMSHTVRRTRRRGAPTPKPPYEVGGTFLGIVETAIE